VSGAILGLVLLAACPDARDARWRGDADQAEAAARACLSRAPEDADAMLELSRALALRNRTEDAVIWADRAIVAAPEAPDPRVWRARLAFWAGELAARIALAEGDAARAEALFTTSLTLSPSEPAHLGRAVARARTGRAWGAFADLDAVCRASGCPDRVRWWRNLAPVRATVEAQALAGLRGGGVQTDSALRASLAAPFGLRLGPIATLRTRTDIDPDAAVGAQVAQALGERVEVHAEAQLGLGSGILPIVDLRGGVGLTGFGPVWLELDGRFLEFEDASAGIIQPSVCGDAGRWGACGRYSAVVPSGDVVRHFGLAQGWVGLTRQLLARLGTGGGNINDFLIARDVEAAGSFVAYAGLEWLFSRHHGISATYTFRYEDQTAAEPLDLHQFGLGYDLRAAW
jgi:hypothetical protein